MPSCPSYLFASISFFPISPRVSPRGNSRPPPRYYGFCTLPLPVSPSSPEMFYIQATSPPRFWITSNTAAHSFSLLVFALFELLCTLGSIPVLISLVLFFLPFPAAHTLRSDRCRRLPFRPPPFHFFHQQTPPESLFFAFLSPLLFFLFVQRQSCLLRPLSRVKPSLNT